MRHTGSIMPDQWAAGQRCGVPTRCPEKFAYIHGGIEMPEFEPQLIIAVDIAGPGLLGPALEQYADGWISH